MKKSGTVVPASPGFYLLILWAGKWAGEEPFVEAAPVVAWRISDRNRDGETFDYDRADPIAPGWEINADAMERKDSAVMDPLGRVYGIESGIRFDSMEQWADWTLQRQRARLERKKSP